MVLPFWRRQLRECARPGEKIGPFWPQFWMVFGQALHIQPTASYHQIGQEKSHILVRHWRRGILSQSALSSTYGSSSRKWRFRGNRRKYPTPGRCDRRLYHWTRIRGAFDGGAKFPFSFGAFEVDLGIQHECSNIIWICSSWKTKCWFDTAQ